MKKVETDNILPKTYVALTYDCLYDDYATVDVHKILEEYKKLLSKLKQALSHINQ